MPPCNMQATASYPVEAVTDFFGFKKESTTVSEGLYFSTTNSKGVIYHLNGKLGKNGAPIYYFSKAVTEFACAKPANYTLGENERTGLPYLKKGG